MADTRYIHAAWSGQHAPQASDMMLSSAAQMLNINIIASCRNSRTLSALDVDFSYFTVITPITSHHPVLNMGLYAEGGDVSLSTFQMLMYRERM